MTTLKFKVNGNEVRDFETMVQAVLDDRSIVIEAEDDDLGTGVITMGNDKPGGNMNENLHAVTSLWNANAADDIEMEDGDEELTFHVVTANDTFVFVSIGG